MKVNLLKGSLAGLFIIISSMTNASVITATEIFYEYGERNTSQHDFNWLFKDLETDITEIELTFAWERMDFSEVDVFIVPDGDYPAKIEYMNIYAKDDQHIGTIGEWGVSQSDTCTEITAHDDIDGWFSDCEGSMSFTLTDASLWKKGELSLYNFKDGDEDNGVDSQGDFSWAAAGFVSATISYEYEYSSDSSPIPEPSTLAIFALGVISLASRRSKSTY